MKCQQFLFYFLNFSGDKPAAMKHSNQSETVETKSSASSRLLHSTLYNIFSIMLIGVYSLKSLDS